MVDGRNVNIMLEESSFVLDRRSIGMVTLSLDLCPDFIGIVRGARLISISHFSTIFA